MTTDISRAIDIRSGRRLELLTIRWNSLEAVIAIVSGLIAGSIALIGFGFDSVIEVSSGVAFGIALAVLSLIVMPFARAKRKVATRINSRALQADSRQTDICAYLSAILVGGLVVNAAFGWWWADPVAAIAMVPIIAKEGVKAVRGETGCDDCH